MCFSLVTGSVWWVLGCEPNLSGYKQVDKLSQLVQSLGHAWHGEYVHGRDRGNGH